MHRKGFSAHVVAALAALGLALLASLAACASDRVSAPSDTGTIALDELAQAASPIDEMLPRPVTVTLRTAQGALMAGVRVTWIAQDHGVVSPRTSVTDGWGHATAKWTLGPDSTNHFVIARADGYGALTIGTTRSALLPMLGINNFVSLDVPTYDGSGQTVHPDYLSVPDGSPFGSFLALTPYPANNSAYENPSVYASTDLVRWRVPQGQPNPIALPTEFFLSDPDLVYDPVRAQLLLYYREVGPDNNTIHLTRSSDAIAWTAPVIVAVAPNHELVSPAIVRRSATEWLMWSVNAHGGCTAPAGDLELRRSTDGIVWSAPESLQLDQPGFTPWHVDVQWIPQRAEYWAVYNVKTPGSCTTTALYFATSSDGTHWKTFPSPVLEHGAVPALASIVYRSTFAYDAASDRVTFWFSGARYDGSAYTWSTVAQRRARADLFTHIGMIPRASLAVAPGAIDGPPLRRPP